MGDNIIHLSVKFIWFKNRNFLSQGYVCKNAFGYRALACLCLPRALSVALAFVTKDPEYMKWQKKGKHQTIRATDLLNASGISVPADGCGIPELQQRIFHWSEIEYTFS